MRVICDVIVKILPAVADCGPTQVRVGFLVLLENRELYEIYFGSPRETPPALLCCAFCRILRVPAFSGGTARRT